MTENSTAQSPEPTHAEKTESPAMYEMMRDHPLLLIAGGIAVGALVAALMPRSVASKLATRALGLAAVAGELGLNFSQQARDSAGDAARGTIDKLSDLSSQAGTAAGRASDAAVNASNNAVDAALLLAKKALELATSRHR